MTVRTALARLASQEDLNFLLTNRIPRRLLTTWVGRISRSENALVRGVSMFLWKTFADLDLAEAKEKRFPSLHACFIRALKDGVRPVDPDPAILASPCDAIVGACGRIEGTQVYQVKGFPYRLEELLGDAAAAEPHRDGIFVTLRLTSSMYHRFHAPCDGKATQVRYMSGDTWNVNPITLKRIERLFCRNERAAIRMNIPAHDTSVTLVAVAAILVASIRLKFLDVERTLREGGPRTVACDASVTKGEEMGWFEHGSTIIVLAPKNYVLCDGVSEGAQIKMGNALLKLRGT